MKNKDMITGLIIGIAIGVLASHLLSNNYAIVRIDDMSAWRINTRTGKVWFGNLAVGWKPIPEQGSK